MLRIALLFDGCQTLLQGTKATAIVRAENHVLFPHGVDQKLQSSGVGARTIDQEVLEKNFRVALLTLRSFVFPKKAVQQQREAAAGAANYDSQIRITIENTAGDHAQDRTRPRGRW